MRICKNNREIEWKPNKNRGIRIINKKNKRRKQMNTKRLTNSEKQIMEVLWKSDVPLSSHDIILSSSDKTWKNSSVHLLFNSLLDKELIEVAGFEKRTKNYARVFKPTLSYVDYILTVLTKNSDKEKRAELLSKLIKQENDTELLKDIMMGIQNRLQQQ